MRKHNFGIIKNQIFNSLVESFIKGDSNNNIRSLEYADVVNNSSFLKLENAFYKYLETKYIKDENSAARYIDECISLFKNYTKDDYVKEHAKLDNFFINESKNDSNSELYKHIDSLLYESLTFTENYSTNIDALHESFEFILNYIKNNQPKEQIKESKINKIKSYFSKEEILRKSIDLYNEKYSKLNESDKYIVNIITKGNDDDKISLFENLKSENIKILTEQLENVVDENVSDKIKQSINKINGMKSIDLSTINKNILNLYTLKTNIKN